MARKNKRSGGIVYSTDPDYTFADAFQQQVHTPEASAQDLRVSLDKKSRGGKKVTLISGYRGSQRDLKELGKLLKSKCGVGGSVKDQQIIIQGDFVDKVLQLLRDRGYRVKKSGG